MRHIRKFQDMDLCIFYLNTLCLTDILNVQNILVYSWVVLLYNLVYKNKQAFHFQRDICYLDRKAKEYRDLLVFLRL